MIKLVVFDWIGTLLADVSAIFESFNRAMVMLNHQPITLSEYREKREVPLVRFYKNLGIDENLYKANVHEVNKAFHDFYEPRVSKARTRSGARQLLQTLSDKNITSIILSNHTVEGIYLQLERLKLRKYFDDILANDNIHTVHSVGKQQHLVDYINQHRVKPSQIAIVGDTVEEIEIGQNLGLKTIAITGGYNSERRLKALKPDVLIRKLRDIIPVLEDL